MNSRQSEMFYVFVNLVLFLSSAQGFPVGKVARHDFLESENPSELQSSSIFKSLSEVGSRFKRSEVGDVELEEEEDIDYELLERLTNEYLVKNGGDLDRELTDDDYEQISENYFKQSNGVDGNRSTLEIPQDTSTTKGRTTAATRTFNVTQTQNTRNVYTTKKHTDEPLDRKMTSKIPDINWNSKTTSEEQVSERNATENPDKWWTSKPIPTGNSAGKTTKDRWWVTSATTGQKSSSSDDGHKSLSWTVNSKGGHQVHVVVYFDK